jgi:hypothetical protein
MLSFSKPHHVETLFGDHRDFPMPELFVYSVERNVDIHPTIFSIRAIRFVDWESTIDNPQSTGIKLEPAVTFCLMRGGFSSTSGGAFWTIASPI